MMGSGAVYELDRVGVFTPKLTEVAELGPGEIGFFTASIKEVADTRVGDTITDDRKPTAAALPGFKPAQPVVFCGLFPVDASDFDELRAAMGKLRLNDASFSFEMETSAALGFGFRCGFLGLLHLEIIQERLAREFDLDLISVGAMRRDIQREVPHREHRAGMPAGPADDRTQPGQEHLEGERLGQIVVCAPIQGVRLIEMTVNGGEHENRHRPPLVAQSSGDDEAVESGQHDVEDDGVELELGRHPQPNDAVLGNLDDVPLRLEAPLERRRHRPLVFDHQDSHNAPTRSREHTRTSVDERPNATDPLLRGP